MKALSVKQPFAGLISGAIKHYEIRSWKTNYRGPLLIHAGVNGHSLFDSYDFETSTLVLKNQSAPTKYKVSADYLADSGGMVCLVDLVGIEPFEKWHESLACCDFYPGLFAWELRNPRPINFIPAKGKLNLFEFTQDYVII